MDPCHPDIECRTFDIERDIRYQRLRYRMPIRYRRFAPSISYVDIWVELEGVRFRRNHYVISTRKVTNLRYRRSWIVISISMFHLFDNEHRTFDIVCWYRIRYRSIWKPLKVYNDGIYLVYTRHTTIYSIYLEYTWYIPVIWQCMSYDRYIPGIYHLSYTCHIPGIYLSYETPLYTGYIPGIYLSHEIVRSARLQNFDCNAAAHRIWIARVFNVQRH